MVALDGKQILDLPSGYYFNPTDDVAIHYLKQKILERELPADIIPTIDDLYTCHPQSIPYEEFRYGPLNSWWFFTSRPNNGDSISDEVLRPNNGDLIVDGIGSWRTLGILPIEHEGKKIGLKKTKRFFYQNPENNVRINNLVICQHVLYEFVIQEASFEPQELTDNVKQKMKHFVLSKVSIMETIEGLVNDSIA